MKGTNTEFIYRLLESSVFKVDLLDRPRGSSLDPSTVSLQPLFSPVNLEKANKLMSTQTGLSDQGEERPQPTWLSPKRLL